MAASHPRHFGSRGKLPKSEQTHQAEAHLRYLHTWPEQPSLQNGNTHRGSWAHSPLTVKGTLIKRPRRVEYSTFQGITEAGSRPLLIQPSSIHQSAASCHADLPSHRPLEALPSWTKDRDCPAAHLALDILPGETLKLPCSPGCLLDLQTETLGLGFIMLLLIVSEWLVLLLG